MPILRSITKRLRFGFDNVVPLFIERTEVARYLTLKDSVAGFTIPDATSGFPASDRHFLDLDAPGVITSSPPVIYFQTTHTENPAFSVRLNATPLTRHTFADDGPFAWHEIIPAGALRPEGNELIFAVNGEGSVRFTGVVILYTSNHLTVKLPLPDPVLHR